MPTTSSSVQLTLELALTASSPVGRVRARTCCPTSTFGTSRTGWSAVALAYASARCVEPYDGAASTLVMQPSVSVVTGTLVRRRSLVSVLADPRVGCSRVAAFMTMTTPSMCPTVCVCSLVAVPPARRPAPSESTRCPFVHPGQSRHVHPPCRQGRGRSAPSRPKATPNRLRTPRWSHLLRRGRAEWCFTVFGLSWWLRSPFPSSPSVTLALLRARSAYSSASPACLRASSSSCSPCLAVPAPSGTPARLGTNSYQIETRSPVGQDPLKGLFVNTALLPEPGRLMWSAPGCNGSAPRAWLGCYVLFPRSAPPTSACS